MQLRLIRSTPELVLARSRRPVGMALVFVATGLLVAGLGARVADTACANARCVVEESSWGGVRRVELSRDEIDRVVVTLDASGCRVDLHTDQGAVPVSTRYRECAPRHAQDAAALEAFRRGAISQVHIEHDDRAMAYGVLVACLFVAFLLMMNGYLRTLVLDGEALVDTRLGSLGLGRTVTSISRGEITRLDDDGTVHLTTGGAAQLIGVPLDVLAALRHALVSPP